LAGEFTSAITNLKLISQKQTVPEVSRYAAQAVLAAIEDLSPVQQDKNKILLTEILQRTAKAITSPADTDNLQQYRALMLPVRNKNWGKLAAGMGLVLVGVALAAISITVAIASFGATSLLSGWGIAVGTSIVTHALAIAGAALGFSAIPCGGVLAEDRPFKKVMAATSLFWQPEKWITLQEAKAPADSLKPR
jgi:hypothetical protein